MEYNEFLKTKTHSGIDYGIKPTFIPDYLFDFQRHVAEYAIKKGRAAIFLDTGLGKTIIELIVAQNYIESLNKPVLIMTPLAVAFQFIRESEKFGLQDIEYSKDGNFKSKIVVCNYERLHYFNPNHFDCVILDESSILKNFKGATKNLITSFLKKVKYRYLFTATPSPNDFVELGTSSEALGYLGYTDMLTKFFTNNEDTISPQNIGTKWVLKGHAKESFFNWVSSWSISMRMPSDLGFDDKGFVLPSLVTNYHSVKNVNNLVVNNQMLMFNQIAKTMPEILAEQRSTVTERCEKAVDIASNLETSVYWCNRNEEGDLLQKMDTTAHQIKGSMSIEKKEEILLGFLDGSIKKLITKPKITAFGLNWQHCNHTIYFPTFSYEQYYQSIRRFWRFGQNNKVIVDLVYSDGQERVLDSLMAKSEKADQLFHKLNNALNDYKVVISEFKNDIELPNFLKKND